MTLMSSSILRLPVELARDAGYYLVAFAAMLVGLPFTLARNPLFVIPTVVLVALKAWGGLEWSWWAVTSPTWGLLALYGSHHLQAVAVRERRGRQRPGVEQPADQG